QANEHLCQMLGYEQDQLLGLTMQGISRQSDVGVVNDGLRRLLDGESQSFQTEQRWTHRLGNELVMLLSVKLVHDAANQPLYFVVHVQDITQRTRIEDSLRENEEIFRTLAESTSVGFFIYRDASFVYVNSAASE